MRQDLHEQLGNTVKAGVDVTRSLVKAKLGVVKTVADVVREADVQIIFVNQLTTLPGPGRDRRHQVGHEAAGQRGQGSQRHSASHCRCELRNQ